MGIQKGQEVDCIIEDLALGGRGLCKVDGLVVFVDQSAPMDRVRARIFRKKKKYAEARIVEIVSPSPHRITPPCPYSDFCGGCKLQFLEYTKQLEYKRKQVIDAIEHIGLLKAVPVHPVIPSKNIFGYRNKMEFSCSDRKWLPPHEFTSDSVDPGFALGLHVPGTFYKVLDTKACLLQPEDGNVILNMVRQFIAQSDKPVYGLKSHRGFWRFLMLRHSVSFDQWMVNIITAEEDREAVEPLAELLSNSSINIVSIVNNITDSHAAVAIGQSEITLRGSATIRERIGHLQFEISANSFFQTNTSGAVNLYSIVHQFAGLTGTETVLDLYCGTGTISIYLADAVREVIGLELAESAVRDARRNCQINGIRNCTFIQGDIRESLREIESTPDLMIIDPPRAGMHKDVLKRVMEIGPPRIVYVSCNPATLARDFILLKEAYSILEIQPVDMFPHTFHIESVARLERHD